MRQSKRGKKRQKAREQKQKSRATQKQKLSIEGNTRTESKNALQRQKISLLVKVSQKIEHLGCWIIKSWRQTFNYFLIMTFHQWQQNYEKAHKKFITTDVDCSHQMFWRAILHYIRKPSASHWRTYLCTTCLSPELKMESIVTKHLMDKMDLEETINFSDFENLIKTIQSLKEKHKTKTLIYNKWTKVTKPLPKGTKISRKIPCIAKVSHVCVDLIK